uniref:Uncharacterized protein n=1 Tax=Echeneis naucrates TaxID=173247 RepID=A0A665X9I9_ECHNA
MSPAEGPEINGLLQLQYDCDIYACWFDRSTIFQTCWVTAKLRCLTN